MTRHPEIVVRALTWNLFHGRDFPPEPELFTWRSRLLRVTEHGDRYEQVNRPLEHEFAAVLARLDWDVALLQEAPPSWALSLAEANGARGATALTARNSLGRLRAALARLNPDLIASNEGGSNQLLVRAPWRIVATERVTLARRPERRVLLLARLLGGGGAELAVANLHASTADAAASRELLAAAEAALAFAGDAPLVFGGDLNIRPGDAPRTFAALAERLGGTPAAARGTIDHLLARGLRIAEPARALPPATRELEPIGDGLPIRLSDHPIVAATFEME